MPIFFTRCFALLLVVAAIVMGRTILAAGDEQNGSSIGGRSVSMSGNDTTPDRHLTKSEGAATERSRTRGTVEGLDWGCCWLELPQVTVSWTNIRPKGRCYLRSYFGAPTSDPVEIEVLKGSEVVNQDRVTINRTVVLRDLDDQFTRGGRYTLELVQEVGLDTVVLSRYYPLEVDRSWPPPNWNGRL